MSKEEISATLVFIYEPPRILLGMKKRGFGAGRWNGFGGKVKAGESPADSARRELFEESCVRAGALDEVGYLHFTLEGRPFNMSAHIFRVLDHSGEPQETEEMRPQWFDVREIPYATMWPEDRYWLPLLLEGKKFRGKFHLDGSDQVITHELHEMS